MSRRYRRSPITLKRFALALAAVELVVFFLYGLLAMLFLLLLVAAFILPWVLQFNTRETDATFEPPLVWQVFATLGVLGALALGEVGVSFLLRGEIESGFEGLAGACVVLFWSVLIFKHASGRNQEWRMIKIARKMWCPSCGARGPHRVDVCGSCGAIVFWAPTYLDESEGTIPEATDELLSQMPIEVEPVLRELGRPPP